MSLTLSEVAAVAQVVIAVLGIVFGVIYFLMRRSNGNGAPAAKLTEGERAGLLGKPKDAARTFAIQRHPEVDSLLMRKRYIGRADAILIAEFGEG